MGILGRGPIVPGGHRQLCESSALVASRPAAFSCANPNGHLGCECYYPLFLFNQDGDLERSLLRCGNVIMPAMMHA